MEAVNEVRQVFGLQGLSDESLDAFTVYSPQLEPASSEAPPAARAALDWLAASARNGGVNTSVLPAQLPSANDPVSCAGSVVRLHACEEGKKESCRLVIVRVTGSNRQPWQILGWR